jgi:hypothetical protein
MVSLGLVVVVGCSGGGNPGTKITGSVTVDGKPLTLGSLVIESDDGKFHDSGPIDGEGNFFVGNAPFGKAKVRIQIPPLPDDLTDSKSKQPPKEAPKGPKDGGAPVISKEAAALAKKIPAKYLDAAKTDYFIEVKNGDNSPFKIEISSKSK